MHTNRGTDGPITRLRGLFWAAYIPLSLSLTPSLTRGGTFRFPSSQKKYILRKYSSSWGKYIGILGHYSGIWGEVIGILTNTLVFLENPLVF